jgi:hypothetical protein
LATAGDSHRPGKGSRLKAAETGKCRRAGLVAFRPRPASSVEMMRDAYVKAWPSASCVKAWPRRRRRQSEDEGGGSAVGAARDSIYAAADSLKAPRFDLHRRGQQRAGRGESGSGLGTGRAGGRLRRALTDSMCRTARRAGCGPELKLMPSRKSSMLRRPHTHVRAHTHARQPQAGTRRLYTREPPTQRTHVGCKSAGAMRVRGNAHGRACGVGTGKACTCERGTQRVSACACFCERHNTVLIVVHVQICMSMMTRPDRLILGLSAPMPTLTTTMTATNPAPLFSLHQTHYGGYARRYIHAPVIVDLAAPRLIRAAAMHSGGHHVQD